MAKVIKELEKDSQYDVHIFNKNINKASLVKALKSNNKVLIITDSGIPKRYLNDLKFILRPLKNYMFKKFLKVNHLSLTHLLCLFMKNYLHINLIEVTVYWLLVEV